ncbi:hypothetical protein [Nostoc sp. FACHB-133]|uniref:hypothetical protein n=1 Tax=Nostoc sp. FACHB-133 TaxID=2692835 RepID=UPI001681EBFC|nr:hypothetical protein [Nostoc sp. FACHB-133]MBD2527365.1 hypothetical protein [Nostoc sp. FACHB-133]
MNYESRRITISYLAVRELCQMFDLPQDVATQALSAGVEKLIFQHSNVQASPKVETVQVQSTQPNKLALSAMASSFKGAA